MTRPVQIPGYRLKDGKLEPIIKARSVSEKIRQKKSKRQKVVRRTVK